MKRILTILLIFAIGYVVGIKFPLLGAMVGLK